MAKMILICGKLCSGKTTYAAQLCGAGRAVLLSVDELMLAVYEPYLGDRHEVCSAKVKAYLLSKAQELLDAGVDVVLDWGFWTRNDRQEMRAYCASRGIIDEWHCLTVGDAVWAQRIARRNAAVQAGEISAYYVDDNLAAKFASRFEPPAPEEIDVWVRA